MIFIILGSQKFQFNRLLKEIDQLIEEDYIKEEVFAQIGVSTYKPNNFFYKNFLDRKEFQKKISTSSIVITHGGTGAIIESIKKGKKVIAVSRLKKFGEHVDDHQIEILKQFAELKLIEPCINVSNLKDALTNINIKFYEQYRSNSKVYIESIEKYVRGL